MQSRTSLDLAANLFATYARETGDNIVSVSWKTSEEINRHNGSNHVASVAIEICAFLLSELSHKLPVWEDDCLNRFVYSPIAMHCAWQMGDLVEYLQSNSSSTP
jgi:hypothetical protein